MSRNKRITIRLDDEQHSRLLSASQHGQDTSKLVRNLIDSYLDEQKIPHPAPKPKFTEHVYDEYWSVSRVAKYYGLATATISTWRKKGLIPYVQLTTGSYRYNIQDVKKAVETFRRRI